MVQVGSALKEKTITTSASFCQTYKGLLTTVLTDSGFPMGPIALAIGHSSVEWGAFALDYFFHEKHFLNVLYNELKRKFAANFRYYIEADFHA
jgi:hypothetical protein